MTPTAEEFFDSTVGYTRTEMLQRAVEFTKFHVEAALKSAAKKAKITIQQYGMVISEVVDKESILNSYDLNQIQ